MSKKIAIDIEVDFSNIDYEQAKAVIDTLLRAQAPLSLTLFTKKEDKTVGMSQGYIATDPLGDTFMMKSFSKRASTTLTKAEHRARREGVNELVGGALYKFLLYDRAPSEGLVLSSSSESGHLLHIRSKFMQDAEGRVIDSLSTFSRIRSPKSSKDRLTKDAGNTIIPTSVALNKLEGFEKVIAACHILGEFDYHAGNLMVQDGVIAKIDHASSFTIFRDSFSGIISSMKTKFDTYQYLDAIKLGNLVFSAQKYSDALLHMTTVLTDSLIDNVVDQKLSELRSAGFNPKGLRMYSGHEVVIHDFDELGSFYKDQLKSNRDNMREVAEVVSIIAKFSDTSPEFQNGKWISSFAKSDIKNPIEYAKMHHIQIEGQDPEIWLESQSRLMQSKYAIKHETIPKTLPLLVERHTSHALLEAAKIGCTMSVHITERHSSPLPLIRHSPKSKSEVQHRS